MLTRPTSKDFSVAPPSPISGEVTRAAKAVTAKMWPKARVVHSMSTGASDSRHLRAVGILAYGVGGLPSSIEDGRKGFGAHGPKERKPLKWFAEGFRFMREVTLELAR